MSESIHRPWLAHYPKGVPAEIDLDEFPSIVALLDNCFDRFRHRPAYTNMGRTISYGDLDQMSRHFASYLVNELKLVKGDRIAMMMPNVLQYPVAIAGALRAGLVVVNTNPMYTARELRHQLEDSGAKAILVLDNFAHTVASVLAHTQVRQVITTGIGDLLGFPKNLITNFVVRHVKKMVPAFSIDGAIRFNEALRRGGASQLAKADIAPGDIAFLQYTGGTTGVAKGAMLTHRNLIANMQQASAWIGTGMREGEEIIITALPLYHIFALTANCLTFMKLGGHNHLITNPRDMPGFVATLARIRYTGLTGVNTLFNGLLNTPGFDKLEFSSLRMTLGGGMAVQRAVAERWKKVTGCTLSEAYGLTETSPAVCINPLDLAEYNGSIGLPVSSTDVCIRDDDGGFLAVGEIGELCVRGPQVMKGYWNRPEETAKIIDAQGWLHTGDIARMDEQGFFYIVDRKKDMILVSGFNVYPNEIEDVVAMMPGVLEVAAIGVPDEKSGEAVKLVIVRKDPALTEEAVRAHCRSELTGYKQPRHIEFRDSLPKSNVGKILRRELREAEIKHG
ncbi:MAG TPA: AMP-binding protein [Dokdonella sp.]|uniref:AMP-binding protein n=2 Tax=Dokdonella sp. TaxID=2291710 RepID=UPI002CCD576F|nr:AMP-binding protein [Dokdonella sp.]